MRPSTYRLVPDAVSTDTVTCLELLLSRARAGEVIGLAYCAMLKQRAFIVNTAGEAHRSPVFARGMVSSLHDELGARLRGDQ